MRWWHRGGACDHWLCWSHHRAVVAVRCQQEKQNRIIGTDPEKFCLVGVQLESVRPPPPPVAHVCYANYAQLSPITWKEMTRSKQVGSSSSGWCMGVARGGSWDPPPNPPVIIFYHGRGGVQYSTVSNILYAVRTTPFMLIRYGVLKDMALASSTVEDS